MGVTDERDVKIYFIGLKNESTVRHNLSDEAFFEVSPFQTLSGECNNDWKATIQGVTKKSTSVLLNFSNSTQLEVLTFKALMLKQEMMWIITGTVDSPPSSSQRSHSNSDGQQVRKQLLAWLYRNHHHFI